MVATGTAIRTTTGPAAPGGVPGRRAVTAIVVLVGAFVAVVGGLWVADHVVGGEPVDDTGWVILGATLLRVVTIGIAVASVARWGRRLPPPLVVAGLWGCAAAQLVYPLTETVVKALVLAGVLDLAPTGIGDLSATGWFNFAVAWLVFGVPGALFASAARSYHRRTGVRWPWGVAGVAAGTAALFAIGAVIG